MVVISKSIQVDFAPGELISVAVADALALAAITRTTVKFKWNGAPMTIKPPLLPRDAFKCDISAKKNYKKLVDEKKSEILDKFWAKHDAKREKKTKGGSK